MSLGSFAQKAIEISESEKFNPHRAPAESDFAVGAASARPALFLVRRHGEEDRQDTEELSPWSQSAAKRCFDCLCVLLALPVLLPTLLLVALAVRFTSAGPVLFLQKRVGAHGRIFTILKFRTMLHDVDARYHAVTTADNQPFTSIGPFLRRWKLDELPQVFNVLVGDMSLVGPRPKMQEHVAVDLPCRPGITGAATIAFAREEAVLDRVPKHHLETYYHTVVLPTKRRLDADYMACATFVSDLKLIVNSVLRRWDGSIVESLLEQEAFEVENRMRESRPQAAESRSVHAVVTEPISVRTGAM